MNITQTQAYNSFYSSIKKEKLYSLITSPNNKILIGVSGGSDSVFLLLSLLEVGNSNNLSVAHINYSLRGKDSDNDQLFVENLCRKKNIKLFSKKVNIINKSNLEAKCRKIRFDFFKELSHKHNYNIIALAHILEDRVENIIMKLLKGGSLETMIQPFPEFTIDNLTYIRPLINIPKELIIGALHSVNQDYRADKTNFEDDFLRNKIRNSILPEFDKINPSWKKSASKLITNLSNENSYLNQKTQYIINKHLINDNDDTSYFNMKLSELFKLNKAIIFRVLVNVIKTISNYNTILSQEIIDHIAKKLHKIYKSKNLSGTINIYQNKDISINTVYSELIIKTPSSDDTNRLQELTIDLNKIMINEEGKSLSIDFNGYEINCRTVNYKEDFDYKIKHSRTPNILSLFTQIKKGSGDKIEIRFRQIKNGDKINIQGNRKKNINKILGDYKIPIEDRKNSFLIEVIRPETHSGQIIALIIHNSLMKSRINYLNYVRKTEESYHIIRFDIKYVL